MDNIIASYFNLGLHHTEILLFLLKFHNIDISKSTLKRHLRKMGMFRKKNYSDITDAALYIQSQLVTSSQLHGYKWLHHKCIQSGFRITQETVRVLLHILDPEGISLRRKNRLHRRQYSNKGPNYLWHIDGYDKLKPYGICISGCIDGFSRKIMWLKSGETNNNPKVIAGYYIELVSELGGCPQTIRSDMGTENGYVEHMQKYFHEICNNDNTGHLPPFLYGTSQHNQRIECWWGTLRKHNIQFWMNLFHSLKDDGLYDGAFVDKSLIQFCFMDIIQRELDRIVFEWNTHPIRKSRDHISPTGRPLVMYELPEIYNCSNYLIKLSSEDITNCREECIFAKTPCDEDFFDLCQILLNELSMEKPTEPNDALNLYICLRNEILTSLT